MKSVQHVTSRDDFATFLTDNREKVAYNEQIFSKEKRGKLLKIKADNELVYEVHPEKKVLVVRKALYMTFHRDAYWDVAKMAELDEIVADSNTLIRI
ncbi:MAG: hypothetical protein RR448_08745 [Niameybacter sp.]|uniref:hypothetical protein n=1 Tax=Niameybacter sp. TaxID=2033640 RepID=UPI002FCBBC94